MFNAYAVYSDSEIAVSEGEGYNYTMESLVDDIPEMFKEYPKEIELVCIYPNGMKISLTLDMFNMLNNN